MKWRGRWYTIDPFSEEEYRSRNEILKDIAVKAAFWILMFVALYAFITLTTLTITGLLTMAGFKPFCP